jgi:SAM-dependent methyltransferase
MDTSKKSLMDDAWRRVYDDNSCKDLPIHSMSCWTEQGFNELFKVTFSLLKNLKGITSVLDVGCGPGFYCAELARRGFNVRGIDYSKGVICKAKKDFPKIIFDAGSAYNLPYSDKSFDLILCIGLLQCAYDANKILRELARTSKKYIILSTLLRKKKFEEPLRLLHKKLETDSWPTRDFHPSEIEEILHEEGYQTTTILKHNNKLIQDGFFIIATKS